MVSVDRARQNGQISSELMTGALEGGLVTR
jgi:hypothetical protein